MAGPGHDDARLERLAPAARRRHPVGHEQQVVQRQGAHADATRLGRHAHPKRIGRCLPHRPGAALTLIGGADGMRGGGSR